MTCNLDDENFDLEYAKRKLLEEQDQHRERNQKNKSTIDESDLNKEIPDRDYFEYVVRSIQKTVKCEDALIRQILYTGFSTYIEEDPLNLGILAPTSEGKTYAVTESLKYFPEKDFIIVGKMSTMVLVRQKGIFIDKETNQPIEGTIKELRRKVSELVRKRNRTQDRAEKSEINEEIQLVKEEIQKVFENTKTLIDLRGKILVFLEPPQKDLWDILKPILSHDYKEIEYPVVDKNSKSNNQTRDIVVRGWPSCIFCSAKDESRWEIWGEIKSRVLITSPNMISQKYEEANKLISQKKGLPNKIQQQIIISENQINIAKQCVLLVREKINDLKSKTDKISLWIPYYDLLQKELPANKGTDVRFAKRVFALLNIVPIVKYNLRKILNMERETSIIADVEDLKEVLSLSHNMDGLPKFKAEFFNDIFLACYHQKTAEDQDQNPRHDTDKDEKQSTMSEVRREETTTKTENNIKGITSRELAEYYRKVKAKPITTDNVKQTYLDQFIVEGLVDYVRDKEDRRQNIYYPLITDQISIKSIAGQIDNFSQQKQSIYEKITQNITEEWIFSKIMRLIKYRLEIGNITLFDYIADNKKFQISDNNSSFADTTITRASSEGKSGYESTNENLTIGQFVKKYANDKTPIDIDPSPILTDFIKRTQILSIKDKIDDININDKIHQ